MTYITPIAAFADNYIWALHLAQKAIAVVDPGSAQEVIAYCDANSCYVSDILITHKHADHIGGVDCLRARYQANVYAPQQAYPDMTHEVRENTTLTLGAYCFTVLATPGHTKEHVSYYCENTHTLFCGDTLFAAGCGRVFDGTITQLHNSLAVLGALPKNTRVFAAHEYSLANLAFAASVDGDNPMIAKITTIYHTLRKQGLPTLPSSIMQEWQVNPFLRCQRPASRSTFTASIAQLNSIDAFRLLRAAKDVFVQPL